MNRAPFATPECRCSDRVDGDGGAGDEGFHWDLLVSRILHPVQVAIIEALNWIGRPLAPSEVVQMFESQPYTVANLDYHTKALLDHGVLLLAYTEPVRGTTKHYYVLAPEFRCRS